MALSFHADNKYSILFFLSSTFFGERAALARVNLGTGKDNPEIEYFLTDHLGSPVAMMDQNGNQTWPSASGIQNYHPYGEMFAEDDVNTIGFTGKMVDEETGQYYFNARYLTNQANPDTGPPVFLSPDSVGGNVGNPMSWNRYGYCLGNPVKYVDPTGKWTGFVHGTWSRPSIFRLGFISDVLTSLNDSNILDSR